LSTMLVWALMYRYLPNSVIENQESTQLLNAIFEASHPFVFEQLTKILSWQEAKRSLQVNKSVSAPKTNF